MPEAGERDVGEDDLAASVGRCRFALSNPSWKRTELSA